MTKVSIFNQEYELKDGKWTGGEPVIAEILNLLAGLDRIDGGQYIPNPPAYLAELAKEQLNAKIISVDEYDFDPKVVY